MKPTTSWIAVLMCVLLTACGGGSGGGRAALPDPVRPPEPPPRPRITVSDLTRGPETLPHTVEAITDALRTNVSGGPFPDGRPGGYTQDPGWYPFQEPPTVRMVRGSSPTFRAQTQALVDDINRWLPYNEHVQIGEDFAGTLPDDPKDVPEGYIVVAESAVGPPNTHSDGNSDRDVMRSDGIGQYTRSAIVWVSSTRTREGVLAHELLHALGLNAHYEGEQLRESLLHLNHPLDTNELPDADGLTLLMGKRLDNGQTAIHAENLGPWTRETFTGRLTNCNGCRFGADLIGGDAVPWIASDDAPATSLAASGLSGTVTWEGKLAAWSDVEDPIAGDTTIDVNLGTLRGTVAFDNLAHQRGDRSTWGDGELAYPIAVTGNGFRSEPGDDPGYTYGHFVGREHGGALGILEHPELTGAFGAQRIGGGNGSGVDEQFRVEPR